MAKKIVYLEFQVYDPVGAAPVTLRVCSHDDQQATKHLPEMWLGVLQEGPRVGLSVFDGAFSGAVTRDIQPAILDLSDRAIDEWLGYVWGGGTAKMWVADYDDPAGTTTLTWTGETNGISRTDANKLSVALQDAQLEYPLLYLAYAGTGGLEGDSSVKNVLKPWCSGTCKFVRAQLVDPVRQIYQVHGYGSVQGIDEVFEGGATLGGAETSYTPAQEQDFLDTAPAQGAWSKFEEKGCFRLGSQPSFPISAHVRGDNGGADGFVETTATTIDRLHVMLTGSAIETTTKTSLETNAPEKIDVFIRDQSTLREVISRLMINVGGYAFRRSNGTLGLGLVRFGASTAVVDEQDSGDVFVRRFREDTTSAPVYTRRHGAEQCHFVHDANSVVAEIAQQAADAVAAAEGATTTFPPGPTPPSNPSEGDLWPDTSTSPTTTRRYDDTLTSWIAVATEGSGWSGVVDDNGLRPDDLADVTGDNTAAAIVGQGPGATAVDTDVLNEYNQNGMSFTALVETFLVRGSDMVRISGSFGHTNGAVVGDDSGQSINVAFNITDIVTNTGSGRALCGYAVEGEVVGAESQSNLLGYWFADANNGLVSLRTRGSSIYSYTGADNDRLNVIYTGSEIIGLVNGAVVHRELLPVVDQGQTVHFVYKCEYNHAAQEFGGAGAIFNASYSTSGSTNRWGDVTGDGAPSDNASADFSLTGYSHDGTDPIIVGNSITLQDHTNEDNHWVQTNLIPGGCILFVELDYVNGSRYIGLVDSTEMANLDYTSACPAYVIVRDGSSASFYINNVQVGNDGSSGYVTGDQWAIAYNGVNYLFYKNNVLVYTAVAASPNIAHAGRLATRFSSTPDTEITYRNVTFRPWGMASFEYLGGLDLGRTDYETVSGISSGIVGQGALATRSDVIWGSEITGGPANVFNLLGSELIDNAGQLWADVSGAGRPSDDADVTAVNIAAGFTNQGPLATSLLSDSDVTNVDVDNGLVRVASPGGGRLALTGTQNGAIRVDLPFVWGNKWVTFTVDVFEYGVRESSSYKISGYVWSGSGSGGRWVNVTATRIGGDDVVGVPVYFGSRGNKSCLWIGDETESRSYPMAYVRDVSVRNYSGAEAELKDGWNVVMDTVAADNDNGQAGQLQTVTVSNPGDSFFGTNLVENLGGPLATVTNFRTDLGISGGFAGQGALATEDDVSWTTQVLNRPAELTDGRITAGLTSSGDLNRNITTSRANSSNILRFTSGGLFSGDLNADLTSSNIASGITGQGALATLSSATWASHISGRPAELTDGRVSAGLNSSGDLNRNITTSRANSSNILRFTSGGLFSGDLNADLTSSNIASGITGQAPAATDSNIEAAADVTKTITGPSSINFDYDSDGVIKAGQTGSRGVVSIVTSGGVTLTSGVSWVINVVTGSYDGANPTISGTGSGNINFGSEATSAGRIECKGTVNGREYVISIDITITQDDPPTGGGGGGSTTTTGNASGSFGTSWTTVYSGTVMTASGVTSVDLTANNHSLWPAVNQPPSTSTGSVNVQYQWQRESSPGSGSWSDVGSVTNSQPDPGFIDEGGFAQPVSGTITNTVTDTGRTASTEYSYRLRARKSTTHPDVANIQYLGNSSISLDGS